MNLSRKKKFAILAAVAAGCTFSSQTFASDTDYVYYNGKEFIQFEFFNNGEFFSNYTLSDTLRNATKSATSYWADILGPRSKFSSAWQIAVTTQANFQNAMAQTLAYTDGKTVFDDYVAQMLQGRKTLEDYNMKGLIDVRVEHPADDEELAAAFATNVVSTGDVGVSLIMIGQHMGANREGAVDGWWVDTASVLPTNEQAVDFLSTFRHELAHALGIGAYTQNCDWDGNTIEGDDNKIFLGADSYVLKKFADTISGEKNWIFHLIDDNGNYAKAGMIILTPDAFNTLKESKPDIVESDYFIVTPGNLAHFVGDNVTEALGGAKFDGISGLPVNGWERSRDNNNNIIRIFEGSHLQTPGMMSHRAYRNYTTFMEVELAVMQDMGYDIDRKAHYGYSIYDNGKTFTNYNGYSARNSEGTAYTSDYSQIPLGVGLHIYGTNNNVTQGANILTQGTGAVGIRVDGLENNLTVPSSTEIHADGYRGKGILIAYGRNQNLNLNGTVTATGEGGNAVEFNFGSNKLGYNEYRGSYIRYDRTVSETTGDITATSNLDLTKMYSNQYNYSADELNSEMVTDFNLSGKIFGSENAIYIAKNAFVKNININEGAEISGNITSDWKNFSEADGFFSSAKVTDTLQIEPLAIQYNDSFYNYVSYIPDLVTNLNFNANQTYSGNIAGADNIKLNVTAGTFTYGGAADVINVNVAKGAKVSGGTFTVNDLSAKLADDFTDDTTGKFYNHGTISGVTINGNLISDGTLSDENGSIQVNGAANVDGSTVTSEKVTAPNKSATVLTANNISGNLANSADNPTVLAPLLSGYGEISGNKINYTIATANNLGALSDAENLAFNAVKNMSDNAEVLPLYSLDSNNAKIALAQIANSDAANLLTAAQQSTVANRVISDRLSAAFSANTINFNVGGLNFSEGDENILMGVTASYEEVADNNFWVKFTKNWGELKGGADYHGSAISGGYDRAFGENWRGGLFVTYNATTLSSANSGGNAYDTRGGFYFGYHNSVDDGFLYIDAGKIRNKLNRSISALGLSTDAKYNSNVLEIGGEYKRNLTPEKSWNVSPFVNFQYSHLKQNSYNETGGGIFNQQVKSASNNYFAGQLGVEFKRVFDCGSYAARFGVKHAFTGADPEFNFSYAGDNNNWYTIKNNQDKTHFVLSIGGENNFGSGWILGGDVGFQKGSHDKDITASVMLRKIW